jgi:hypothetical protein
MNRILNGHPVCPRKHARRFKYATNMYRIKSYIVLLPFRRLESCATERDHWEKQTKKYAAVDVLDNGVHNGAFVF